MAKPALLANQPSPTVRLALLADQGVEVTAARGVGGWALGTCADEHGNAARR
ncbi:MAG: hypothetical protein V2A73_20610 [Pseudomonadota bacterium]